MRAMDGYDFRFESKYDAYNSLASNNKKVDADLEALHELGILNLVEQDTGFTLFIAVSATLRTYTLTQQLHYCMLLFHLEKLISNAPTSVPEALKVAINRSTTEEKLSAYDPHTQIKMGIAQHLIRHFDPDNEELNSSLNHQAQAFIKFCFSNKHHINIHSATFNLPNTLTALRQSFEQHFQYDLTFLDRPVDADELEAKPLHLSR
ncbi:MAG: hypothetical protein P1U34_07340 [Coxiellaceae bacterium]|nr:hypothetical protein [Coxiellaceae bacterium]